MQLKVKLYLIFIVRIMTNVEPFADEEVGAEAVTAAEACSATQAAVEAG